MKQVAIEKHAFVTESSRSRFYDGESFAEAFGSATDPKWMFIGQTHKQAIMWAWLQWHLDGDFAAISAGITRNVERTVDALKDQRIKDYEDRGYHDFFLMHAAVVSGDLKTMRRAAEFVVPAKRGLKRYQYDAAVAGILASHVLGDSKQLAVQVEIFETQKPNKADFFPSRALVRAFAGHDAKRFNAAVDKAVQPHRIDLGEGHYNPKDRFIVVEETEDRITFSSLSKGQWLWPYVDCAFAKLAAMDGMTITHDSFWLPRALVEARNA